MDLDRSFVVFNSTPRAASIYRTPLRLSWSSLLAKSRVVVLADAGSGKTTEFQSRAELLNAENRYAFFIEIQTLADHGLLAMLSRVERERFSRWESGADEAWFLLDALDDARIAGRSFKIALKRLADEIGARADSAHILVSSRVSDWQTDQDPQVFQQIFPCAQQTTSGEEPSDLALLGPVHAPVGWLSSEPEPNETSQLTIVQLSPLDEAQRRTLAHGAGVADTDAFEAAVERSGLVKFAERPSDLLMLADYWCAHQRFDSVAAMFESLIGHKLAEENRFRSDNERLTPQRARLGAERIAAALTLCNSLMLRSPGGAPENSFDALDPASILDDWTDAERNALLRRGIFVPASYGRIRFHHRSTQEYLVASWLQKLLGAGCPLREVWNLIFREHLGFHTVASPLREVAAWLSLWQPAIRDEVAARAPLLLTEAGDVGSLPVDIKRRLLLSWAEQHATGTMNLADWHGRPSDLFAEPMLGGAIREAWDRNPAPEFRTRLLQVVAAGSMIDCSDLAWQVVADDMAPESLRDAGLAALASSGDRRAMRNLAALLQTSPERLSTRLTSHALRELFPTFLTVEDAFAVVLQRRSEESLMPFLWDVPALWEKSPVPEARRFMATKLIELSQDTTFVAADPKRNAWFAGALGPLAESLAARSADTLQAEEAALLAIIRNAQNSRRAQMKELREQQRDTPRDAIWITAREMIRSNPDVLRATDAAQGQLSTALLMLLTEWLKYRTGIDNCAAILQWPLLAGGFGPQVPDLYRRALLDYWRATEPQRTADLAGDQALRGSVAFFGITLEASTDANWASQLSEAEVERAVGHAYWGANRDIPWINALVEARPSVAVPCLRSVLIDEWRSPETYPPRVLQYFAPLYGIAPPAMAAPIQRIVCELFTAHEPGDRTLYELATNILRRVDFIDSERDRLESTAYRRVKLELETAAADEVPPSLGMLYLGSPGRAIEVLSSLLQSAAPDTAGTLAAAAFQAIFDWNYPSAVRIADQASSAVLEQVVQLAYRYVPASGDVDYMNFTEPGQRMPAQHARAAILDTLVDRLAPQLPDLLHRLEQSGAPEILLRDARLRAYRSAEQRSESPAWTPAEVRTFERTHNRPLKTGIELLDAACDVLADIQRDFSRADWSSRRLLQTATDEAAVQGWLAEQLKFRSHGRFNAYTEPKISNGNMPDIVLASTAAPVEVALEIKRSESHSKATLSHALQKQLVERYLRPGGRRAGILVVTHQVERTWRAGGGDAEILSFATLVRSLQAVAAEITRNYGHSIEVRVIGIDADVAS
jgi:hypothetical protein